VFAFGIEQLILCDFERFFFVVEDRCCWFPALLRLEFPCCPRLAYIYYYTIEGFFLEGGLSRVGFVLRSFFLKHRGGSCSCRASDRVKDHLCLLLLLLLAVFLVQHEFLFLDFTSWYTDSKETRHACTQLASLVSFAPSIFLCLVAFSMTHVCFMIQKRVSASGEQ